MGYTFFKFCDSFLFCASDCMRWSTDLNFRKSQQFFFCYLHNLINKKIIVSSSAMQKYWQFLPFSQLCWLNFLNPPFLHYEDFSFTFSSQNKELIGNIIKKQFDSYITVFNALTSSSIFFPFVNLNNLDPFCLPLKRIAMYVLYNYMHACTVMFEFS
jgi:hypothetical protein